VTAGHAAEVCLEHSQALDIEAFFLILVSLILGNSSRFAYLSVETQSLFCHTRYLAQGKDDSMAHMTYMPIQPWVTVEKMTNMFVVYRPSTSWNSERTLCKPLSMTLFKIFIPGNGGIDNIVHRAVAQGNPFCPSALPHSVCMVPVHERNQPTE
jgi:hypothetical protein